MARVTRADCEHGGSRAHGLASTLLASVLLGVTSCGQPSDAGVLAASVLELGSMTATSDAAEGPAVAATDETADAQLLPWEEVEADAYDTILGSGFTLEKFVDQWGGFGADGRHRPDADALYRESLRGLAPRRGALTPRERADLELRYDEHEPAIREAAHPAYDTLRVALDDVWQAGRVVHRPASDPASGRASAAAYERARSLGGYTYYDTFTTGGWEVQVIVPSPEHPRFHAAFSELRRAVRAREADARQLLGLP